MLLDYKNIFQKQNPLSAMAPVEGVSKRGAAAKKGVFSGMDGKPKGRKKKDEKRGAHLKKGVYKGKPRGRKLGVPQK